MLSALTYFKALADETRLRLLHVLYQYELSVNELVSILQMGQSRISRHLKILTEASLLQWRRDGLWVFYTASKSGQAHDFIMNIMPFIQANSGMQADINLAAHCLEARTLKTRQFFNAIAENWDMLNAEILGDFNLANSVCDAVTDSCELAVDLGCGTGSILEKLLNRAQHVVGVDGSSRMLELARRRFEGQIEKDDSRISLRIGELDHLPLRDSEADFACINLVLHHLSNPIYTLKEVHRILRPQGRVFIADFDKHNNENMREKYGDRWLGFTEQTLCEFFQEARLTCLTIKRETIENNLDLLMVTAQKEL